MDNSNTIIETERLRLVPINLSYQEEIFKEFTSEITTYMFPKPADAIAETVAFIESSLQKNQSGTDLQIVVTKKDSGEFLGCGGLHHIDTPTPELGIWIKKSAHGHEFGKETMIALKSWADQNLNYEYIIYPVDKNNFASRRIPEFLGGKITREYKEVGQAGQQLNMLEYRIYPPAKSA